MKKNLSFIILTLLIIASLLVINNQIKVKNKYINKFEDLLEFKNEFSNLQRNSYLELGFFQKEKININSGYEYYEFKDEYNFLISNGPRGYLDFYDDYLFLITGTGKIFFKNLALYLESENINNLSKLKFTSIESDFRKFAGEEYLDYFKEVVKDFTIVNDIIFVSYIKKKSEDCYFNSVAKSDLNFNKLIFEDVIVFDQCYPSHHYQSGGAIEFKNKNEFFITIGDYHTSEEIDSKFINSPQDPNLNFGKIYLVNFIEKTSKLISLGHRNPQGIFYDKENDILFNAEHGPQGGDEININKNLSQISNFGLPISSYGNHSIDDPKLYELVPLNKSHEKNGLLLLFNESNGSIIAVKFQK